MARERGPRVGILGGGQLGWMMVLEGRRLGISFGVLDPDAGAPAARIADRAFRPGEGAELASWSDVVTYEFENAEAEAAEIAEAAGKLRPGLRPLLAKRNRLLEKRLFVELGIPTADFRPAGSPREVEEFLSSAGSAVVKALGGGYDGKGVRFLRNPGDAASIPWGYPVLVEEMVDIREEISVIVARSKSGEEVVYPAAENHNAGGILLYSIAPARDAEAVEAASRAAIRLARSMDYVGVLAVEFLVSADGRVLANEFAPRVHNTGHWSLCGAATSQFENHLRAILDMPLGSTEILRPTGIVNILGISRDELPVRDILSVPGARLWWYGKAEARPGRKMGHACVVAGSDEELRRRLRELMAAIYGDFPPSAAASVGAGALESEISHLSRSADA
jgi:5-(carboxyamino)imidazole ribonucleotide synthase